MANGFNLPPPTQTASRNPLFRTVDILTGGILGGITGDASKRREDRVLREQQIRAAVEEDARRRAINAEIEREYSTLGLPPVVSQNGQPDYRQMAILAQTERVKQDAIRQAAMDRARQRVELEGKGAALGVPVQPEQPGFAQNVFQAEKAAKLKQIGEESEARAKASAPYENQYSNLGPFMLNGKYLGNASRNLRTNEVTVSGPDGKSTPLPTGAEPVTSTGLQKDIPSIKDFRQLKQDLTQDEISLRGFERYMNSVQDANVGLQRMADKFSAGIKTLFGKDDLSKEQLATKVGQGQLQGLIGANRINVVGGGVMTEQDAQRILQRLGGDFDALSNPAVVKQAMAELYSDRYSQYEDNLNFYNSAVNDFYGSRGFKPAKRVEFSERFRESLRDLPAQESQPTEVRVNFP